jgi:hypothetical protein
LNFPFEISINLNLFLLDRGSHSGQNEWFCAVGE